MIDSLISVIIPVYNVESYLEKCVQSIQAQTHSNLEIILVDDGSLDQSPALCDSFAACDTRIKVIHQKNAGLSAARNAGLEIVTGEYVSFVDSDDFIAPSMLETLLHRIKKDGSQICVCAFAYVNEHGCCLDHGDDNSPIKQEVVTPKQMFRYLTGRSYYYYVTAWNRLYRRDLFDHLRFPVGKVNEDEFIAHHLYGACERISCESEKLYYYRQRKGSIMNSDFTVRRLDVVEALLDRVDFFQKCHFYSGVWYVLNQVVFVLVKAYDRFENSTGWERYLDLKIQYDKVICRLWHTGVYSPGRAMFNFLFYAFPTVVQQIRKIYQKVKRHPAN